ncbi:BrnA antitoxin family protein [Salmonella enterica]|nr:hypothetical protein [Salmonella enterica subsp. enterica serovar Poona]EDS4573822.1 BrnA antitoxin family protein [Salmonella enterica]EEL9738975.1 BrnA antitoxin family protein [Salmonella enterica subsp. enterica serovar Muenchen]HCL5062163.1 BrnA antitoxin family protein [Salmonella enterica]
MSEVNASTLKDFIKPRHRKPIPKRSYWETVKIPFSPEVVEAFRATGDGWQTRMNAVLKDWLKQHKPEDVKIL